jgi:hypothetical protein
VQAYIDYADYADYADYRHVAVIAIGSITADFSTVRRAVAHQK